MDPWTLIGWIIAGIFVLFAIIILCGIGVILFKGVIPALKEWWRKERLYLKSRNVKPKVGQYWYQSGSLLEITFVDDDRVGIRCGNSGWGDSIEDWKKRVKSRKLYLSR